MNLSDFGEREGSEQRRFHERRAAAREQHDEQSLAGGAANKLAGGFADEETLSVRFRMAALEALQAPAACGGSGGSGDHTAEFCLVRKKGEKAVEHAVRGFAHGEHAEIGKSAQIELLIGATQGVARNGKTALHGGRGIDGFERAVENLPRELFRVHRIEYRRENKGRSRGMDGRPANCGAKDSP